MTIQLRKAERLCSAAELTLVKAALAPALRQLDEQQLAAHVTRARRARDKHLERVERQKPTAGRSADTAVRERERSELFQEVLDRFEARSAELVDRDGRKPGKRTGKKASKQAAKKQTSTKASGKKAAAKKAVTKKAAAKKAATKNAATKRAATKGAATDEPTTKKAPTKKAAKKRHVDELERDTLEHSAPEAGRDGRPLMKTPAELVADKVRAKLEHTGVARQANDPGVTDRQGARFVSDRAKIAAQHAGSQGAREQAIHGHVASAGRRNQAKRDRR